MKKIITTTSSFSKTVEETDLKQKLAAQGVEVVLYYDFAKPPAFDLRDVFGIVAGHTPEGVMLHIGSQEAELFPNLKVVSPFGVGMNHIDVEGLKAKGLEVKILPHFSKRTVAELALSFIFSMARRIPQQTADLKRGVWQRQNGVNIAGKTLGIVGLGSIGKEVAKLGRGIGMNVVANDISYDEAFMKEWQVERADLDTVIVSADFLTFHVPYIEGTGNLLSRERVSSMKKGAFLVNVARGDIIDEAAVLEALESGHLSGAALDVFSAEPPFSNDMLVRLLNSEHVLATPHVGAYTPETRYAIAEYICNELAPHAQA